MIATEMDRISNNNHFNFQPIIRLRLTNPIQFSTNSI